MRNFIYTGLFLLLMLPVYGQTKSGWIQAAEKAFTMEDYSTSLSYFISALEYDDNDPYLLMMTGECNRRLFEYEKALLWLNKAAMADDNHNFPMIFYRKAEAQLAMTQYDEADKSAAAYASTDHSLSSKSLSDMLLKRIAVAREIYNQKDSSDVFDAGKSVNSPFSDFAPVIVNDTTFWFSSLRFQNENSAKKDYYSLILSAALDSAQIGKAKLITDEINNKSWHNCNASVSPDGKIMVFSRCNYNADNKLICRLYESRMINNKWQTPVALSSEINQPEHTSTQPCITSAGTDGYHLYFASDRKGSKGSTDIYYSLRKADGSYSPVRSVTNANTAGREVSPFYNPVTNELFFSSDSLQGLGALDIYKLNMNDPAASPLNAGMPFNSGYNDIYFIQDIKHDGNGFFCSNRPGTKELNGNVCCYDIFRYQPAPKPVEEITARQNDSLILIPPSPVIISDPLTMQNNLKMLLPLKLYFDNDFPDPRSRKKTTSSDYQSLFSDYSMKLDNYIKGYAATDQNSDDARDAVERFFINDLQFNYKQLDKFTSIMQTALEDSNSIQLTVQGFASPLAETAYNLILSSRRINCLLNYWQHWNNGLLLPYIQSGKLKIVEIPSGERQDADVSDKADDIANSVYNPKAARERRIEVVNVTITQ